MKTQLLISPESKMIYGVASAKGKTHDFKVFKDSKYVFLQTFKSLEIQAIKG